MPEVEFLFSHRDADWCRLDFVDEGPGPGVIVRAQGEDEDLPAILVAVNEAAVQELTRALNNRIPVRGAAS